MKTIFFVVYGGGHILLVKDVIKTLIHQEGIRVRVLALTTAYPTAKEEFPSEIVRKVSDYTHLFDDCIDTVYALGLKYLSENHTDNCGIEKAESITYLGLSFYDLIQRHGEEEALALYDSKKRQAFLPISIIKKILVHEQADIVVATTSPKFEQASMIAGNDLGLKTLSILDLFGELYPLPIAQHIVCMNPLISDSLKAQGVTDSTYHHLGQPAIEATVKSVLALDRATVEESMGLSPKITLLYATQRPACYNSNFSISSFLDYEFLNDAMFSIVQRLHDQFDITVLLRIHPNENLDDFKPWLDKYPFVQLVNDKINLHESLAVTDILVTHSSTVGVEALLSGKLVMTFKHHKDTTHPFPTLTREPFNFNEGFEALEASLTRSIKTFDTRESPEFELLPFDSVKTISELLMKL